MEVSTNRVSDAFFRMASQDHSDLYCTWGDIEGGEAFLWHGDSATIATVFGFIAIVATLKFEPWALEWGLELKESSIWQKWNDYSRKEKAIWYELMPVLASHVSLVAMMNLYSEWLWIYSRNGWDVMKVSHSSVQRTREAGSSWKQGTSATGSSFYTLASALAYWTQILSQRVYGIISRICKVRPSLNSWKAERSDSCEQFWLTPPNGIYH
jgi:hypothetical protein